MSMQHLYFGMKQKNPWRNVSEHICRELENWKAFARMIGMPWSFQRGSDPKCSISAFWSVCCMAVHARSLPAKAQKPYFSLWASLWSACSFSGAVPVSCNSGAVPVSVEVLDGKLDLTRAFLALRHVIPAGVQALVLSILGKLKISFEAVPLPTLGLALSRCACLATTHAPACYAMVKEIGIICALFVEEKFLRDHGILCAFDAPGNQRYGYRLGKATTQVDARIQATKSNINGNQARLPWPMRL